IAHHITSNNTMYLKIPYIDNLSIQNTRMVLFCDRQTACSCPLLLRRHQKFKPSIAVDFLTAEQPLS
ncbi:hypothetical protein, partial [Salmonella enterica]|uniref:hypothetical protein n=1 Tax=Salmonella enterica TaxID=28901 RepID=UPI00234B7D87